MKWCSCCSSPLRPILTTADDTAAIGAVLERNDDFATTIADHFAVPRGAGS